MTKSGVKITHPSMKSTIGPIDDMVDWHLGTNNLRYNFIFIFFLFKMHEIWILV